MLPLGRQQSKSKARKTVVCFASLSPNHPDIAARRAIKQRGGDPDKEMPKWTPYQMRQTAATKVRKYMGYESAGAALGHTNMSATAIYAERNQGLADEAARKLG